MKFAYKKGDLFIRKRDGLIHFVKGVRKDRTYTGGIRYELGSKNHNGGEFICESELEKRYVKVNELGLVLFKE